MELILMIFCHLVDDYILQGWLASAKQKVWWKKNAPKELYKDDYKVALIEHAFMNATMVHIPVYLFLSKDLPVLIVTFLYVLVTHALIDNEKANKLSINLITDQVLHILIILHIYLMYIV